MKGGSMTVNSGYWVILGAVLVLMQGYGLWR